MPGVLEQGGKWTEMMLENKALVPITKYLRCQNKDLVFYSEDFEQLLKRSEEVQSF